jgi:hypothetical protein
LQNIFPDVFPLICFHQQKPEPKVPGEESFCGGSEQLESGVCAEVLEGGFEIGARRPASLAVNNQAGDDDNAHESTHYTGSLKLF